MDESNDYFWNRRHRVSPSADVPDDVFVALVDSLFEMATSKVLFICGTVLVCLKVALDSRNALIDWLVLLIAVIGTARIATILAFRGNDPESRSRSMAVRRERLFAIGAWLSSSAIGALVYVTFTQISYIPDHILVEATACGIVGSVVSRNAGRPRIAAGQIVFLLIPICIASLEMRKESYTVLCALNGLFLFYGLDTIRRLHAQRVPLLIACSAQERAQTLLRLNEALATAKLAAEKANVSKTHFLAAASHDLLQPLSAARLYAASLKERLHASETSDDSFKLAQDVETALEAVEDILTALLDISRLDAGAMNAEVSTFDLDDIWRQLRLEFEPLALEKNLVLRFMPSSVPIVSDRRLLRRLLRNLVSNAIKYTPRGRILVGVRRAGPMARIEVWDTGIGIPKSQQSDIFQEFERLPAGIASAPGVGLGLSIVRRLSEVLDHDVTVRSTPGRGSVFSVAVLRAKVSPLARSAASRTPPYKPPALEGLVVAVIDNEQAILSGMSSLLEGWRCTVVTGLGLTEITTALQRRGTPLDVIIADYHLDGDDGLSVIFALRERYGACHAVLATADHSRSVFDAARAANVRVLNKPLKPAALRALLTQWRMVKQPPG